MAHFVEFWYSSDPMYTPITLLDEPFEVKQEFRTIQQILDHISICYKKIKAVFHTWLLTAINNEMQFIVIMVGGPKTMKSMSHSKNKRKPWRRMFDENENGIYQIQEVIKNKLV